MHTDREIVEAVTSALSPARMSRYETTALPRGDSDTSALLLYAWNAEVSGALLTNLHICEVVIRNAVSGVLETLYGDMWPWSRTFELSLPDHGSGYSPRRDLCGARRGADNIGKVVPELKLVFWQKLFTRRYDARLWDRHLSAAFPFLAVTESVAESRAEMYRELDRLRELRNRIAHHEPIFLRDLEADHRRVQRLVTWRCPITAIWLASLEKAGKLIASRPGR